MVEIIAHRGARSLAPENTLAAAKRAWELGADRWETDVSFTRDGHLVLFHDDTLSRCTDAPARFGYSVPGQHKESGGRLPLEADRLIRYTLAELVTLDLGSVFLSTDPFSTIARGEITEPALSGLRGEKIPTLEQGVVLTRDLGFQINIELKDHGNEPTPFSLAAQTLAVIEQTGIPLERVVLSSFNHDWLNWLGRRAPEIEIQALVGDDDGLLDFKDFSFMTYNVNSRLISEQGVRELKARGKKVNLFTVNDSQAVSRFIAAGADGIITDFPQQFVVKKPAVT
jgi:glycerophosphoryl diester phosphodiesterase